MSQSKNTVYSPARKTSGSVFPHVVLCLIRALPFVHEAGVVSEKGKWLYKGGDFSNVVTILGILPLNTPAAHPPDSSSRSCTPRTLRRSLPDRHAVTFVIPSQHRGGLHEAHSLHTPITRTLGWPSARRSQLHSDNIHTSTLNICQSCPPTLRMGSMDELHGHTIGPGNASEPGIASSHRCSDERKGRFGSKGPKGATRVRNEMGSRR